MIPNALSVLLLIILKMTTELKFVPQELYPLIKQIVIFKLKLTSVLAKLAT